MKLSIGRRSRFARLAPFAPFAALFGVAACGTGGNASSRLAKEPTYAREAKCAITKSQAEPLIVEWPSSSRAKIEALAKTGVVAVRYNGCEMEVLASCNAPGKYGYTAITAKRDRVVIKSADDLYANIPLGAAALEGKLETSGELDVAMAIVGRYATDKRVIRADELEGGDCAKATHFVSALTVGAFEFFAGADASIAASAGAGGLGAGAKSTTKRELLNSDGKMTSCDAATTADTRPPEGCGAVVRLEVVPLGQAKKDDPVCPSGMHWNGAQCVKGAEGTAAAPARGSGEELRFEVGERDQTFTISVESGGVTHSCAAPVTYHKPCKIYDVPDGPATVHARGDVNFDREIKVDESGRADISAWNRGRGSEIGLGITLAASSALVGYAFADSGGFSSPGHQSLDIVLVTVGGVFGLVSLIGFPAALFSNHDLMTVKRGNNAQFVGWSPLRLTGVGVAPAGATVKSGGTLGLTFAF